jgi:hypothetical protein
MIPVGTGNLNAVPGAALVDEAATSPDGVDPK